MDELQKGLCTIRYAAPLLQTAVLPAPSSNVCAMSPYKPNMHHKVSLHHWSKPAAPVLRASQSPEIKSGSQGKLS